MSDVEKLNMDDISEILKSIKYGYRLVSKEEYYAEESGNSIYIKTDKQDSNFRCFCKTSAGELQHSAFCKYCGNGISPNRRKFAILKSDAVIKELKDVEAVEKRENPDKYISTYSVKSDSDVVAFNGFYVKAHPDYDNGIVVYKVKISINYKKAKEELKHKVEKYVEIVPGVKYSAYKSSRKNYEPDDIFNVFGLNSNTKRYNAEIVWAGANSVIDFMLKNDNFRKQTAFIEMFNVSDTNLGNNSFFLIYMYLYSRYHAIEFLVKMGYYDIIEQVISSVCNSSNKTEMYNECNKLEKIFNKDATKGSLSLCVPKYIGDYLNESNAGIETYYLWSSIYSYDAISKENFNNYITSNEYYTLFSSVGYYRISDLANLLKYGYTIDKLTKYIVKQSRKYGYDCSETVSYLKDYYEMAEIMDSELILYPENPKEIHDKFMITYQISKNEFNEKKISNIANTLNGINLPDDDSYCVVFPCSIKDFIEEGNAQCNCVASYVNRVVNGQCLIFFVRDKQNPNNSLITCEYRSGKLVQIRAKYNSYVNDNSAREYANKICTAIYRSSKFSGI